MRFEFVTIGAVPPRKVSCRTQNEFSQKESKRPHPVQCNLLASRALKSCLQARRTHFHEEFLLEVARRFGLTLVTQKSHKE
jgi:hypothetical protein